LSIEGGSLPSRGEVFYRDVKRVFWGRKESILGNT
jgi:hypothetical protein